MPPDSEFTQRFARWVETDDPLAEDRAKAAAAQKLFGDGVAPTLISDRYVVGQRLGSGGCGVVYAAVDRQLGRQVAIKLLLPATGFSRRARARLEREAQVLAKLSHPNVVTVFDMGVTGEQIYVAMELVEGPDLAAWLTCEVRTASEVIAAFVQAARGLAAAHARGIVHRDFKPSNVMVGASGTIKVLDFGIAWQPTTGETESSAAPELGARPVSEGASGSGGLVMGTVRYMSPEQHDGTTPTARSDVYSFCAALFEALGGELPWQRIRTPAEVRRHKGAWSRELPARPGVSRRVRDIVRRGLEADALGRPASMEEVISALVPRAHARPLAWAATGGALAASLAVWIGMREPPGEVCTGRPGGLDDIWNQDSRAEARGTGYEESVLLSLDRWVQRWEQARLESCRATHVLRAQSGAMLDRRESCLQARRAELEQLVESLAPSDGAAPRDVTLLSGTLSPISECDQARLLARDPSEVTPGPAATALDEKLGRVRVLIRLGRHDEAEARHRQISMLLRERPDAARQARALLSRANLRLDQGRADEVLDLLEQAVVMAERGRDPIARAHALTALAFTRGTYLHEIGRAEHELDQAEAILVGTPASSLERISIASVRAQVIASTGRPADALPHAQRALELGRASGVDPLKLAELLSNLGTVYGALNRHAEAGPLFLEALETYESHTGGSNPKTVILLSNLGASARALGNEDEASRRYHRALSVAEGALDPDGLYAADVHGNLGRLEQTRGNLELARDHISLSIELTQRALGKTSPAVAHDLISLAGVFRAREEPEQAIAAYEQALAIYAAVESPPPRGLMAASFNLADMLVSQDRGRAMKLARAALGISSELGDPGPTAVISEWLQKNNPDADAWDAQ